ncbi:hypothetical protein M0R45_033376 [Rubus argutus]|uniref:Uncharacterized protein n=1 Tax=Rubus argutus TaxID=59490 RepID=A0AAW1WP42_RUBAR
MTRYYTYYTTNENGADDFEGYDPTPYEGGYDMGLTYGRPMPPSEKICYRHSSSPAQEDDYDPPEFSSLSEPNAYNEEKVESEYNSYIRPSHEAKHGYSKFEHNQQQQQPQQQQQRSSESNEEEEERTLAGEGGYGSKKYATSPGGTRSSWWPGCCSSNGAIQ